MNVVERVVKLFLFFIVPVATLMNYFIINALLESEGTCVTLRECWDDACQVWRELK